MSVFYLVFVFGIKSCKKMDITSKSKKFNAKNSFNNRTIKIRAFVKEQGTWAPPSRNTSHIERQVLVQIEEKAHWMILSSLANGTF